MDELPLSERKSKTSISAGNENILYSVSFNAISLCSLETSLLFLTINERFDGTGTFSSNIDFIINVEVT